MTHTHILWSSKILREITSRMGWENEWEQNVAVATGHEAEVHSVLKWVYSQSSKRAQDRKAHCENMLVISTLRVIFVVALSFSRSFAHSFVCSFFVETFRWWQMDDGDADAGHCYDFKHESYIRHCPMWILFDVRHYSISLEVVIKPKSR